MKTTNENIIERIIWLHWRKFISPNTATLPISKKTATGFSKKVSKFSGGICSAPKKTPDRKNAALRAKSTICFVSLILTCIDAVIIPNPCAINTKHSIEIGIKIIYGVTLKFS